ADSEVSPRFTCAARLGSMRQAAARRGREVTTTLPLISPLTLKFLMLILPSCLAAPLPSRPPMASLTASFALADSEPLTFSVPVAGVVSNSASWAPATAIGPREAVQPISAFCRTCETGLSALPPKVRAVERSAASRIAISEMATGAITREERAAGGSGGNSANAGILPPRGDSQSMALRLTKKETATTAAAIRIVLRLQSSFRRLRFDFRRIVPPPPRNRRDFTGGRRVAPDRPRSAGCRPDKKNGAARAPFLLQAN